jgi:hypothetical protein
VSKAEPQEAPLLAIAASKPQCVHVPTSAESGSIVQIVDSPTSNHTLTRSHAHTFRAFCMTFSEEHLRRAVEYNKKLHSLKEELEKYGFLLEIDKEIASSERAIERIKNYLTLLQTVDA